MNPEAWESVILQAQAVLESHSIKASPRERAWAACAFLFAFDLYWRGGDAALALRSELRPPAPRQKGAAAAWTITLFPESLEASSKTGRRDVTGVIGGSHPDRAWVADLCLPLLKSSDSPMLFPLHPSKLLQIYHDGRRAAGLAQSHPHRLRHGGASMDAMLPGITDLQLAERGDWAALTSVARYRRPAAYIRELQRLSRAQMNQAQDLPKQIVMKIKMFLS